MRLLAAALILALAAPLGAQELPAWRAVDAATGQIADVAGLEQLARDFPDSANVRLHLFRARLAVGDRAEAMDSLRWLIARGHSFSPAAGAQILTLMGAAFADEAKPLLTPQPAVVAASVAVAEISAEAGLIESVLVTQQSANMVATSVSGKMLHIRGPDGMWLAVPIPGANDLSGIVSAVSGDTMWIASANINGSEDDDRPFTGLIGMTENFNWPKLVAAPEGVTLSDLAVGPDGTVYASDPTGGGVYRALPGADALEVLVAPGILRSPQGLAVSANGARLYVSDYRYGLAVIDLANGMVTRLASDVPIALDGVDGLWLHRRELVAMQNGTTPMRISAFALSDDGTRIIAHRVLEQAHPEWTEPLGGSIADGALYYVATGQWDRYDKGALREEMTAIPTMIRRLPLEPR